MSRKRFQFNFNWIAIGLLAGAFLYSAFRFFHIAGELDFSESDNGQRVIRIAHWQLEPGFREALQWTMDQYNALPHVQEARIRIEQAPIPERVYNQFMNVHLISGTAPDIAVRGKTELIRGNALAKFYSPIGNYVDAPNPYNAPQYQVEDLPEALAEFLATAPWRDTFFDGLIAGYNPLLSDYYAIPICSVGGFRLFYNLDLMEQVKAFALEQATAEPTPAWIAPLWRSPENMNGYLSEEKGTAWLQADSIPETLGQFVLYCHALEAYAAASGQEHLVPIAGSNYPGHNVIEQYKTGFLSPFWETLHPERGSRIHAMEMLSAYREESWSFHSPEFREYFTFMDTLAGFYPTGFLGLDREQAQRRFVLGLAGIIQSGGWDASSILSGIAKRDTPESRFEVAIAPIPLPAEGERWHEYLDMRISEANARGAVPFAINKQTPHFDWCLDYLKFLTSHRINEGFSQRAGWLPVISGARVPESIAAFTPIIEGFPQELSMDFGGDSRDDMPTSIRNAWDIQTKLFMTGDIDREAMIEGIRQTLENPQTGIRKAWSIAAQKDIDRSRAYNRSVSVARLEVLTGTESAAPRERSTVSQNLSIDEGIQIKKWWHELHPDEAFPSF